MADDDEQKIAEAIARVRNVVREALSRAIGRIQPNGAKRIAPPPSLANQTPTWGAASSVAHSWGLNQLADSLDRMAG